MERIPIPIRMISKSQVEALLTPGDVIDIVEETFRIMGEGGIFHPVKEPMWMDEPGGNMLLAMPAHIRAMGVVGVKWVNLYTHQVPGLPASYGNLLILSRQDNAQPYAIIEATPITTMPHGRRPRRSGGQVPGAQKLGHPHRRGLRGGSPLGHPRFLTAFPGLKELRLCDLRPEAMERVAEEFRDKIEVRWHPQRAGCRPHHRHAADGDDGQTARRTV